MLIDVIDVRGLQQRGDGCPGPAATMAARNIIATWVSFGLQY